MLELTEEQIEEFIYCFRYENFSDSEHAKFFESNRDKIDSNGNNLLQLFIIKTGIDYKRFTALPTEEHEFSGDLVILKQFILTYILPVDIKEAQDLILHKNKDGKNTLDLCREFFGDNDILSHYLMTRAELLDRQARALEIPREFPHHDEVDRAYPEPQAAKINPYLVQEWIKKHPKELQPSAKKVIDQIQHISFAEFKAQLFRCVDQFNDFISEKPDQNYAIFLSKTPNKSFSWVISLIKDRLEKMPIGFVNHDIQGLKYIQNQSLKTKPASVDYIVVFDDASYSGSELDGLLESLDKKRWFINHPTPSFLSSKFCTVIPYMTERSVKGLSAHAAKPTCFYSQIMPEFKPPVGYKCDNSATATYFDHKVADRASTVPCTADGRLIDDSKGRQFVPEVVPPYKEEALKLEISKKT